MLQLYFPAFGKLLDAPDAHQRREVHGNETEENHTPD